MQLNFLGLKKKSACLLCRCKLFRMQTLPTVKKRKSVVEKDTRLSRLKERCYASLCCFPGTREERVHLESYENK